MANFNLMRQELQKAQTLVSKLEEDVDIIENLTGGPWDPQAMKEELFEVVECIMMAKHHMEAE